MTMHPSLNQATGERRLRRVYQEFAAARCIARGLFVSLAILAAPAQSADLPFVTPYGDRGCWVSIFDGKDFTGAAARLSGPTFLEKFDSSGNVVEPDLRRVGGQDFMRRIDSIIVGPHARAIAYAGQWFSAAEITFRPNARVPDLDVLNFSNRIESLKVQCVR